MKLWPFGKDKKAEEQNQPEETLSPDVNTLAPEPDFVSEVEAEPILETEHLPKPPQETVQEPEVEPEPEPQLDIAKEELAEKDETSWLARLTKGLSKSSSKLTMGISDIFTKRKLDDDTLEELEELLIMADMGPKTAAKLAADFAKNRFGKDIEPEEVKQALATQIADILKPVAKPLTVDAAIKPYVIFVVGVNGTGKTTTIAKLAQRFRGEGKSVLMAAGDTFRAAAVEQLNIWAQRTGSLFVAKETGADAAAVAYEAIEQAKRDNIDIVLIDTAGRLHNKKELMEELAKVYRVIGKNCEGAPHKTIITLDATTGQNAVNQVELFNEVTPVDGMVVTKLDGSAKGGIVVALAEKFGKDIYAVGVGETAKDLEPFEAEVFANSLLDL